MLSKSIVHISDSPLCHSPPKNPAPTSSQSRRRRHAHSSRELTTNSIVRFRMLQRTARDRPYVRTPARRVPSRRPATCAYLPPRIRVLQVRGVDQTNAEPLSCAVTHQRRPQLSQGSRNFYGQRRAIPSRFWSWMERSHYFSVPVFSLNDTPPDGTELCV